MYEAVRGSGNGIHNEQRLHIEARKSSRVVAVSSRLSRESVGSGFVFPLSRYGGFGLTAPARKREKTIKPRKRLDRMASRGGR